MPLRLFEAPGRKRGAVIGEASAIGAAVCWAVGSHLFGRIGRDVPPGAMNLGKCASALVMFAAAGLVMTGRLVPSPPAATLPWLVGSGVVGLAIGDSAYFGAMALIGVRRALLLLSTAPVFAAVGGALFLGEALGRREIAAIAAVLLGVGVVVNEQDGSAKSPAAGGLASSPRVSLAGVLYGGVAGLSQAVGSLMSRFAMTSGVNPLDTSLVRLTAGVGAMILVAGLTGRIGGWGRTLGRPRLLAAIGGLAFVGTFCGLWLSQIAIGRASSTAVASTLLATSPIFALPLGRLLNAERVTLRALGGTALAVAGLVGLTLGKS
ncbi:MAG: DMT family transporter [Minicystis sp.]